MDACMKTQECTPKDVYNNKRERNKYKCRKICLWVRDCSLCHAVNVSNVFYRDMDEGLYCSFNPSKADGGVM